MLKNIKIGARLSMGFGVILILMFILGIFAINRLQSAHTSQQALVHDKWFKALVINKLHKYNDQMALRSADSTSGQVLSASMAASASFMTPGARKMVSSVSKPLSFISF